MTALLHVSDLSVSFVGGKKSTKVVKAVSFDLAKGDRLGIIGESGSGKSQTCFAIAGILAENGRASGQVVYEGRNLLELPTAEMRKICGNKISVIFQDPMSALNPYMKISHQLMEPLILHKGDDVATARAKALRMLERVEIPDAGRRFDIYPHEISGGMRQRVMIAMALLCEPEILIADEPTTALDVTVQAQILKLLDQLIREMNSALIMISHDLGVIAETCNKIAVMYAGEVVEYADVASVLRQPAHPYTQALLNSMVRLDQPLGSPLAAISGQPPTESGWLVGCSFKERCNQKLEVCGVQQPDDVFLSGGRRVACHLYHSDQKGAP